MDLALDDEGAQIVMATSYDGNFSPNNILDGDNATRWMSTGSYPQEIIIQLATSATISKVKTWSINIRNMEVFACMIGTPTKWEPLFNFKFPANDGNLQVESEDVRCQGASFLKLKILSGWDDFISLQRVSIEGSASNRR